jgi:hypothetical protein
MNNIAEMLDSIDYHIGNIDEDGFSNTRIVAVIKELVDRIKEALLNG